MGTMMVVDVVPSRPGFYRGKTAPDGGRGSRSPLPPIIA
jgi:hypothetical protein